MSDQWVLDSWDTDDYLRRMRRHMSKLPEGRKPLDNQWYRDKIRAMTKEERQRAKEKEQCNNDSSSEQQQ